MISEIPTPIKEAIAVAPTDPCYDGPKDNRVSLYVTNTVDSWKRAALTFNQEFAKLEAVVTDPKEIEAIKFYLASAAITLAGFNDYPQSQTSKIREAEAGVTLF